MWTEGTGEGERGEANVAVRDEAQMQDLVMSRNVQEAAESARAAAAEYDAATAQLSAVRAQAGGRLPPQAVTVVMGGAAASRESDTGSCRVCTMGVSGGEGGGY